MKFLFLLPALALGSHTVRESRDSIPAKWVESGSKPSSSQNINLTLLLRLSDRQFQEIESEFLSRSDPSSANFGQWLSNEEVHSLTAPEQVSVDTVMNYFTEMGAAPVARTSNSDTITVSVPFETAEKLLDTTYSSYKHTETGDVIHRAQQYSLPDELHDHVALVGPTTRFPTPSLVQKSATPSTSVGSYNTPSNLRSLYSVGDTLGGTAENNKQAVTAFLGQYYSESDLEKFFETQFPEGADTPIKLVGDATTGRAGIESMLDIEYMPAMGALNPTEFWGFSGASPIDDADEPFLTWLYTVSNTTDEDVPLVFSTSYGEDETAEVPTDYADRINVEFMKAGLRGISILFASGDSGAASDSGTCPDDRFMPMWPAGSPYVTAVGGTSGGKMPEEAWSGSSGGFSDVFPAPSWQVDATSSYAANTDSDMPPSSYFNSTGRGFPDISAQAVEYPVVVNGFTTPVAGTSCATPCASGVFGLLNDARLSAGKSSLGFLNQILYSNPTALNDITEGVQGGCGRQSGFPAKEGWDAVTGLGSPNYEKLLEVVMALP